MHRCKVSKTQMIDCRFMNWRGCRTRQSWLALRYYCSIWLDINGQMLRNGDFGHKNTSKRPIRHVTNNVMWDLRFSRWWTCKSTVLWDMTTCSFVGCYRFVRGNQLPPSSGRTRIKACSSRSLVITYEPIHFSIWIHYIFSTIKYTKQKICTFIVFLYNTNQIHNIKYI